MDNEEIKDASVEMVDFILGMKSVIPTSQSRPMLAVAGVTENATMRTGMTPPSDHTVGEHIAKECGDLAAVILGLTTGERSNRQLSDFSDQIREHVLELSISYVAASRSAHGGV